VRNQLGAKEILENIQKLNGFTTRRELADFFGVGPSAVTDWVNRKGNLIPTRRLAEVARRYHLRWQWLTYGEGQAYETNYIEESTGVDLAPQELELLAKIKNSIPFKRAVDHLLGLPEEQVVIISRLVQSMSPKPGNTKKEQKEPVYRHWNRGFPLTTRR
jgi:hypothetical protein